MYKYIYQRYAKEHDTWSTFPTIKKFSMSDVTLWCLPPVSRVTRERTRGGPAHPLGASSLAEKRPFICNYIMYLSLKCPCNSQLVDAFGFVFVHNFRPFPIFVVCMRTRKKNKILSSSCTFCILCDCPILLNCVNQICQIQKFHSFPKQLQKNSTIDRFYINCYHDINKIRYGKLYRY